MQLYSSPVSNNCRRVLATIEELGLDDVEVIDVNLAKGEQRRPAFLAINPNGKVPALVDGERTIWESSAIMHYLARGSWLEPKDFDRIEVMRWQAWDSVHFGASILKVVWERLVKPMRGAEPDKAVIASGLAGVARFAPVLEQALTDKTFLLGDALSLADLSLASDVALAAPAGIELEPYPNIRRWYAGMAERPSMKKTTLRM